MKYLVMGLLLCSCIALPKSPQIPVPKPIIQEAVSDTVALVRPGAGTYCSGVILQNLVATAAHCVDGEPPFWVGYRGPNDEVTNVEQYHLLHLDPAQDLALMRPTDRVLSHGRLLAPEAPVDGDRVIAVGHPVGLKWTITEGIVSRHSRTGGISPTQHWMQVSAPIYFGNSGGPIYNTYGEVVGIASFIAAEPHLAGVVHWEEIRDALDQIRSN